MASIDTPPDQGAWNQAYERLVAYLATFALDDRAQVSRLAVKLLDEAREIHQREPTIDPVTTTLTLAQKRVADWLGSNLGEEGLPEPQIVASGGLALLLSGVSRSAPRSFLSAPLPEELRQTMRQTFLTTGPGLNLSSMTPRHFDYGPMLDFARQTWHRWEIKSILIAVAFWAGIYALLYWGFTVLL